jgi:hypothetical protein
MIRLAPSAINPHENQDQNRFNFISAWSGVET